MALDIIGAGFGRTGTESMKRALEMLGVGSCYHMYEVMQHPERVATWRAAANGALPDWDAVFDGFRATVDWPAAFYWRELSAHFPEAKILLTVRDPEAWVNSMENTILPVLRRSRGDETIATRLVGERVFGGRYDDRDHLIAVYERNIAEVQASFGPDRLLTYELGSGWQPLCDFLEREVPDAPYPMGNDAESFHKTLDRLGGTSSAGG